MTTLYLWHLWNGFEAWAIGFGGAAFLVGLLLIALWFFTPAFLSSPEAKAVLLNTALGCLAFAVVSGYYTRVGYQAAVEANAAQDRKAIERKVEGDDLIKRCRAEGGSWDVTTGECNK